MMSKNNSYESVGKVNIILAFKDGQNFIADQLQSIVGPNRQQNYDEYEQKDFESAEQKSLYPEERTAQFRPGYFQPQSTEHINQRNDGSGHTSGSRSRAQVWSKTSDGQRVQNNSLMRDNDSNMRDPNMTLQQFGNEFAAVKRSPFDANYN